MGVPDGHVHKGGFVAGEVEIEDFGGADAAELDAGLAADNGEALDFAGVEVVAAGDAGFGGGEGDLAACFRPDGFDKGSAVVGVHLQLHGVVAGDVHEAAESVEEVKMKQVRKRRESTKYKVRSTKGLEDAEDFGDALFDGVGDVEGGVAGLFVYVVAKNLRKFAHVDEFQQSVDIDKRGFAVGELVAEGGHHGVVIGVSEGAVHVGNDEPGEGGVAAGGPLHEHFAAFAFGASVGVVALLLGGRGEEHLRGGAGGFKRGDQLRDQADVGVVDHLQVAVAVHGGEVDDHIEP